jgi:hypothetical protein
MPLILILVVAVLVLPKSGLLRSLLVIDLAFLAFRILLPLLIIAGLLIYVYS